jgi:hypothetical protein
LNLPQIYSNRMWQLHVPTLRSVQSSKSITTDY